MFALRSAALRSSAGHASRLVARSSQLGSHAFVGVKTQHRFLNVHEYQAMEIFEKHGVSVPRTKVAHSAEEAETVATAMNLQDFVIKAQVLAGGRGKGHFDSGFQSGVHMAKTPSEARQLAEKMIGNNLITKQTGSKGKPCNKVMISEKLSLVKECYFAILMDRDSGGPMLVASSQGGMDIEKVAEEMPDAIHKVSVDIVEGLRDDQVTSVVTALGWDPKSSQGEQTAQILRQLYDLFLKADATQIEINPLAETASGKVLCCDAKLNFDSNAAFRQKELFTLRDTTQEDPREVRAEKFDLNYIGLDGNIGCLVNGAGLAMATMDVIKLKGGTPANFLDVGGGATTEQVTEACKLLDSDPNVQAILVNIFGGIMRCDVIAEGLIRAANQIGLNKPMIVRLAGTNVDLAKKMLDESGLKITTADDLDDAAEKAVASTAAQQS